MKKTASSRSKYRVPKDSSERVDRKTPCALCGGPHDFDTSVPSAAWNRVIRPQGLPEHLCTTCIVREFVRAGTGFTAQLYNEEFSGVPIEVVVNSKNANDAALVSDENTAYRVRIEELENVRDALVAACQEWYRLDCMKGLAPKLRNKVKRLASNLSREALRLAGAAQFPQGHIGDPITQGTASPKASNSTTVPDARRGFVPINLNLPLNLLSADSGIYSRRVNRMLSHRKSAYCPTCGLNSSQERVKGRRGVRYCGGCGNYFTLKESRQAEHDDLHIAAVDFKYEQQEAEKHST